MRILVLLLMLTAMAGCARRYDVSIAIEGDSNTVEIKVSAEVPKTVTTSGTLETTL